MFVAFVKRWMKAQTLEVRLYCCGGVLVVTEAEGALLRTAPHCSVVQGRQRAGCRSRNSCRRDSLLGGRFSLLPVGTEAGLKNLPPLMLSWVLLFAGCRCIAGPHRGSGFPQSHEIDGKRVL